LIGGVEVVLGLDAWWVVLGGVMVTWFSITFYCDGVNVQRAPPHLEEGTCSLVLMHMAFDFCVMGKKGRFFKTNLIWALQLALNLPKRNPNF
jgi:hypothetical protein